MEFILKIYWTVFFLSVVANLGIHLGLIVPELRKNGSGIITGLWTFRYFSELRRYKEICLENNKPLTWYTVSIQIHRTQFVMLIGWILLIFGADSVKTVP
jgi:hypothetical protein